MYGGAEVSAGSTSFFRRSGSEGFRCGARHSRFVLRYRYEKAQGYPRQDIFPPAKTALALRAPSASHQVGAAAHRVRHAFRANSACFSVLPATGYGHGGAWTISPLLFSPPTDMRKRFDGRCGRVRSVMKRDPCSGTVLLNRRRAHVKLLVWDRTDFARYPKRLASGAFA